MQNIPLQLLIHGLIAGSTYALVAAGFSLIYSTTRTLHFAHGGVISLSAVALYWFMAELQLPVLVSVLGALVVAALLGFAVDGFLYEPLRARSASSLITLVGSAAALFFMEAVALLVFGADSQTLPVGELPRQISFFGAHISVLQLMTIGVAGSSIGLLQWLMRGTKLGRSMRAVADNETAAEILGISARRVRGAALVIGSLLAGVAAVLIALETHVDAALGTNLLLGGFAAAVLGGVGSVPGAVVGGLVFGLLENFGAWFVPPGFKTAFGLVLLVVVLLVRPSGLLGRKPRAS